MKIISADITGSLIINNQDVTTTVESSSIWSGSIASRVTDLEQFSSSLDATFATDQQLNQATASLSGSIALLSSSYLATSGSYNTVSSSFSQVSGSFVTVSSSYSIASGSLSTRVTTLEAASSSLNTASGSFSTRVTNNEATGSSLTTASGSFSTRVTTLEAASASLNTASGSFSTRTTTLEQASASLNTASGSLSTRVTTIESKYATTGSNTYTGPQYVSHASNAIGFTSTASLYTDGGLRVTKDAFVSGTLYLNNLTVYGTSSIQYATSSQLNVGTNIITVNTNTPILRFGGLAVYDSGSTGLTGSILWDSEDNQWIYSNPSGSTYDSAMFLVGPRNSAVLGNEVGINCNFLSKGNGMHHMTSSAIFDDGSRTCFYGSSIITSTGVGCFSTAVCATAVIGGTISGTTGTFSSNVVATGSLIVAPSSNVELQVQSTGVTIGNLITDTHNITGSLRTTGSITGVGNACFTSVCSPSYTGGTFSGTTIAGTTLYGSTAVCAPTICGGNVCGTTGCFGTTCSPSYLGGTFSGTTISGTTINASTAVCGPTICGGTVCGTVGCFASVCSPAHIGGTFSGTTVSGTTLYGSTAVCGPTIFGTTIVSGSVGCFITICSPTHIGGTYSGTTNYASTIACSPIGCFATSCATSFIGGTVSGTTISGTTIYGSTNLCGPSVCTTDGFHCSLRMACRLIPFSNYRTTDCGYGGIDFFDNGKGYQCSAKFYTFQSVIGAEWYGLTNDYNGTAQLALVSCVSSGGNISFFTGTSTTARLRIDDSASTFRQTLCVLADAYFKGAGNYNTVNVDNTSTTGGGGVYLRQNGTVAGGIGVSGWYDGNTACDLLIVSETGRNIRFYTNAANERLRIASTGEACFRCQVCTGGSFVALGCIAGLSESTYIGVDAGQAPRLGFMKKPGIQPFLVYAQDSFTIASSSGATIDPANTFTARLTISTTGVACFSGLVCTPSGHRFGGGSTTLNYYEEGTWTPVLQGAFTAGTTGYANRSASYVRIGNYVYVRWGFQLNSISGASGTMRITGLPFTGVNWGSYQEPNVSVSTGNLACPQFAGLARVYVEGSGTALQGRIANNGDTSWDINQFSGDEWVIGEIFYNV